jgi:hypothetical protein
MSETESQWRCKVIVMHRAEGRVRFGLTEGDGRLAVPWAPFASLLAIDAALVAFARETLGLEGIRIHERFVERPDPLGAIYYLVEAEPPPGEAALVWREAAHVLREEPEGLGTADRKALALAMRFLSGGVARL